MANRIQFQIGYSIDKAGLTEMQSLFQQIAIKAKEPGNELNAGLQKAATTANTLDGILEKTFNTKLGTLNVTKFNQELSKSGLTLKTVQSDLSQVGNQGATAYNRLAQAVLGTNLQLKESNKLLDSMADTFTKTVKWGIASSVFNNITNAIQKAYTYSKQLDSSLNDIRIVTDKSAENMDRFAEKANTAAKELGANTLDYTKASLIYYQQGLSDEEAQARAETTVKAANVTGQTGEEVSEQLTAVWNGYKVTAEETEAYVDKLAAVAATTASDLEELSTGMSKVASAANSMGVDIDQLNAQLSTIISVTRQAPETAGTALKTIYARMGDLKVDGQDEFGVKLGDVSAQMETMGVSIMDQTGNIRDMGEVIEEVAQKWNTWTEAQRQAAAVAMAGKRQYNNLIALFDNWDMYTDALKTSQDALGTLQHQQDIYMESTEAKLNTLKSTWQDLYKGLIDQDELNAGVDALTNLVQTFDNFIDSFGGGLKSITAFGAIVANIFNKQIANSINAAIQRQDQYRQNIEALQLKQQTIQQGTIESTGSSNRDAAIAVNTQKQLDIAKQIYDVRVGLSTEEYNELTTMQQQVGQLAEQQKYLELQTVDQEKSVLNEERIKTLLTEEYDEASRLHDVVLETYNTKLKDLAEEETKIDVLEQQVQKAIDLKNQTERWSGFKTQILKKAQAIGIEEAKIVDNLLQGVKAGELTVGIKRQIIEACSKHYNLESENLEAIENQIGAEERVFERREQIAELKEKELNLENSINAATEKGAQGAGVTQVVTTITSSLGSMAMAWSSVSSLIKTINDDTVSFGDKITQSFMTLGMTVPMVLSSFTKLNEAFGYSTGLIKTFQALSTRSSAISTLNSAGFSLETKALKGKTQAEIEDLLIQQYLAKEGIILQGEGLANIASLDAQTRAEVLKTIAEEADDVAIKQLIKDTLALNGSMLIMNPVLLAVVATLAALAATIAIVVKRQEEWHKKEKEKAQADLEEIKNNEEKVSANKELVDSYDALVNKYNTLKEAQLDTTEVSKELYDQTLELAKAYDIQGASLLALGNHYDILNNKIKEQRKEELEQNIQDAYQGAEDVSSTIAHDMSKGTGHIIKDKKSGKQRYFNSVSTYGLDQKQSLETAAKEAGLENQLEEQLDADGNIAYTYKIDFDIKDPEAAKAELDNINKIIEGYKLNYNDIVLETDAIYQEFLKEQEQFTEHYQELIDQLNVAYESRVNLAVIDSDLDNLESTKEVYEEIQRIKSDLGDIPEDSLNQLLSDALSGIENIGSAVDKIDLAEEIADKTGDGIEKVLDIIDNFNSQQLSLIQIHLDSAVWSNDLDEWVKNNSLNLEQSQRVTTGNAISNALANYDEKKGFKEEDLNAIYSQGNAEQVTGMTAEQFSSLDYGDQIQALTDAWIANTKEVVENKKEIIKSYNDQIAEYEILLKAHNEMDERDNETFNNLIKNNDELVQKKVILKKALIDLADQGYENLNFEEKELIKNFTDLDGVTDDVAVRLGKTFKTTEDYNTAVEDLNSLAEEAANTEEDHAAAAKAYGQALSANSAILDNIQAAYKNLTSIVEEYNETGAWTIDNVQQLIAMDDSYVATLQFENGQLSINEQAMQAMTLAKLDDMEASIDAAYQERVLELAHRAEAEANKVAGAAEAAHAQEMAAMGTVAEETANKVNVLANALNTIDTLGSQAIKDELDEATKAYENKKKALEDARSNVKKGGSSFKRAMGAGGKSGGGGGSKKQDKETKEYEEEFDRYWEIKKAIDAVDRALKRLDKDQENLYGYELINSLKQENQLLEQQKKHYEELAAAQRAEAAELQGVLAGYGVAFDASGAITNYAAATMQALAQYNAAIAQYNAGLIDESALGVYEKNYEAFKKALQRYETLYYQEMQDTQDKLDDIWRQELANNLKAWEVEVKLKLDMKELKRGWQDFINEITDDFQKVYQDLRKDLKTLRDDARTYTGSEGTINTIVKAVRDVTKEIDKMRAGGSSSMFESISQAQEKLKELNQQLQDAGKSFHDLWVEAWKDYLEGIEQVSDQFDDLIEQFERINDELEFQKEIIQLLYGEEAYGLMDELYKGQEKNTMEQIKSLQQQKDMWEDLWRKSGATMDNQSSWTEDQKKYYDQWMKAQGDLNNLVLEYIQLLKDDYLNTVDKILKDLETAITGSSLKDLETEWERISAHADKYYDSVEGAYKVQSLANKIDQSIAAASNIKAQQKLEKFREREIDYLREKKNLTEYDLDAAEARYQIALKEIALEEAQNNKTSMKLTRNEQGNWSYQYVADQDDVASKKQELLDAYGQLYQLASDAYEANLESLTELHEKYLEGAKEIAENDTLNEEQKQQKLYELREWYLEEYKLLATDNALYRDDLQEASAMLLLEIYKQDEEAYTAMTETEKQLVDALKEQHISDFMEVQDCLQQNYKNIGDTARDVMAETRADWTSGAQTIADLWNADEGYSVKMQVTAAYNAIIQANNTYQARVKECAAAVERDFGEDGISGAIRKAGEETDRLKGKTEDMVRSSVSYLNSLKYYVDQIAAAWQSVQQQILNTIALIEEYLKYVGEANRQAQQQAAAAKGGAAQAGAASGGGSSGGKSSGSTSSGGNENRNYFVGYEGGGGNKRSVKGDLTLREAQEEMKKRNATGSGGGPGKFYVGHYATGGYTGSWNNGDSDGRLAFLHQKELVLNKDDTANFLSGITMLRDMSSLNGSISNAIMSAVAGMVAKLANLSPGSISSTSSSVANNDNKVFNINAEFPNAGNVDEIREAILSLPNLASQYIANNAK